MKITIVALLVSVLSIYATEASSQNVKISIHANRISTKEVIAEIEKQTDYLFVYNKHEIDINRLVSFSAEDESVTEILSKIFADTDVSYKLIGKNISLIKQPTALYGSLQQKEKMVNGWLL